MSVWNDTNPPYIGFKVPYTSKSDWLTFLQKIYNEGNPLKVHYALLNPEIDDNIVIMKATNSGNELVDNIRLNQGTNYITVGTDIAPSKTEISYLGE